MIQKVLAEIFTPRYPKGYTGRHRRRASQLRQRERAAASHVLDSHPS